MTTEKQRAANQKNALKCTGPKTKAGKDKVKQNAIQHGFFAEQALLVYENEEQFLELSNHFHKTLNPVDADEWLLVERMIQCIWKLKRLGMVERTIYEMDSIWYENSGPYYAFLRPQNTVSLSKLGRYEATVEASYYRARDRLFEKQEARRRHRSLPPPQRITVDIPAE